MKDKNRRQFLNDMLKGSAALGTVSPLAIFVDSILTSALAQSSGDSINPRRLISIQQPQAPARWSFDMFLTPYLSDSQLATFDPGNQMIRTRFSQVAGRNSQMEYATVRRYGINVPHMWQFDVPESSGGSRPMADLLPNMLSLQGINTTNAGHDISRRLHFLPAGAAQSTGALASDYGNFPLGNIGSAANFAFLSKFGKSPLIPGRLKGNYLTQLLNPFILSLASSRLDPVASATSTNYQRLNRIMDTYARSIHNEALSSVVNKANAHEVMLAGFGNLSTIWSSRLAVYESLITRALDQSITYAGFNDYPTGPAVLADRGLPWAFNSAANIVKFDDVNELFSTANLTAGLAGDFVLAEYLILNDLSNSVCINIAPLTNLKVVSGKNLEDSCTFDEHSNGGAISLLTNFWYNRALSACLLELTDQLSAKNVVGTTKNYFEESVIELWGEFHRSARTDGSGSDHGSTGKSVMYLSGAIDGPTVVGALGRAPSTSGSPGSWGQGAVDPVIHKHVTNAEMAATLAGLIRVPSPFTTASPMAILQDDGSVLPVAIKTRIV